MLLTCYEPHTFALVLEDQLPGIEQPIHADKHADNLKMGKNSVPRSVISYKILLLELMFVVHN